MSKKVAYIIPLHKKSDLVFRAIESVPATSMVIVSMPDNILDWFTSHKPEREIHTVCRTDGSSYPMLVNIGLKIVMEEMEKFDLINILEYDDVLSPHAEGIIDEYSTDWTDVEIFAPLTCVVKYDGVEDKPTLIGIANEAPLAPQMAEEHGLFDFNMMLRSNFLFVNGCYIKPSVFESYGLFKENFELFYDYEWALRAVYNGAIIKCIPKTTHLHSITDDSAFEQQKNIPQELRDKWLGATRREYFFNEDRKITLK